MPANTEFIEGSNISITHLGIVAGAFDSLGIEAVIDRAIPKTRHHHLSHGQPVRAMVLTGQTKKQTQRPTLKWTFFRGVRELKFSSNGSIPTIVTNMTPELGKIRRVLGWGCEKYYF